MNLLECLIGLALSLVLVAPLIKNSGEFIAKQIQYEKSQSLTAEADRALELIGRAIRMAGYQNANSAIASARKNSSSNHYIQIQKNSGYRGSDSLMVKQEISQGVDFDCIGNTLSKERTKNNLAQQGFLVDRQASAPKGAKVNGGSLICQSLDRQGRIHNTTLMNGIHHLSFEVLPASADKAFKIVLEMTDGASIHQKFERTFTARNLR
ncbi:MAG: PilW family protein [Polynucleobacter sp.]